MPFNFLNGVLETNIFNFDEGHYIFFFFPTSCVYFLISEIFAFVFFSYISCQRKSLRFSPVFFWKLSNFAFNRQVYDPFQNWCLHMVRSKGQGEYFYIWISNCSSTICWRDYLFTFQISLAYLPLSKINWLYMLPIYVVYSHVSLNDEGTFW